MKILIVKNENGLTLIEVLAALTLTTIIMVTMYSFFFSYIKNDQRINTNILVRNESVQILEQLNNDFENVDTISNSIGNPSLTSFDAVDKKLTVNNDGTTTETDLTIHVELRDDSLYVNNKKVNDSTVSLTGTQFYMENGDLDLNLVIASKADPNVVLKTNTVFSLGDDSH